MSLLPFTPATNVMTRPYWHRPAPWLATKELDPGTVRLRETFPRSWETLLAVKSYLDGMAMLDTYASADGDEAHRRLARTAARALGVLAGREENARPGLADSARRGAASLDGYAATGEWPETGVRRPEPGEPWLYCGPLKTWGRRATRAAVTLLVSVPDPERQAYLDTVDAQLPLVRSTVAEALDGEVQLASEELPAMDTVRLLLAGGESAFGHKNFAHFFPLEVPNGTVRAEEFTVVFTNVHQARVEACSLPLYRRVTGRVPAVPAERIMEASLTWFRSHDLGHFWRLKEVVDAPEPESAATFFEKMALEEAYADSVGLLCARRIVEPEALEEAFSAELLRYLSRDPKSFADSTAAVIELGWLAERGADATGASGPWLERGADALAALATTVHDSLWGAGTPGLPHVTQAFADGHETADRLAPVYGELPTDLDYVFG